MHVASIARHATPGPDEPAPKKASPPRPSARERSEAFEAQKRYMAERFSYHHPADPKPRD
jgi:hypothetical protein